MTQNFVIVPVVSYADWCDSEDLRDRFQTFVGGLDSEANIFEACGFKDGGLEEYFHLDGLSDLVSEATIRPCAQAVLLDAKKLAGKQNVRWLICHSRSIYFDADKAGLLTSDQLHQKGGQYAAVGAYAYNPNGHMLAGPISNPAMDY